MIYSEYDLHKEMFFYVATNEVEGCIKNIEKGGQREIVVQFPDGVHYSTIKETLWNLNNKYWIPINHKNNIVYEIF